jgi:glyoxylase-like metal-dependent hydrolase (beta-lactamase superfamily II)
MPAGLLYFARRRPKVVALLGILMPALVLVVLYRWYSAGIEASASAQAPRLEHSSIALVPGIYYLGAMSPSAVYVIESPKGLILVDSGLESELNVLKSEMAKVGLDWKRICAVLLTHVHGDHSGGAQDLRAATGATVYAGEGDVPVLSAGTPRVAFFSTFYMPGHEPHPTTVDVALKGGEKLDFGGVRIEALAMPGHTPGSMCYLLERENHRVLFAGDVIMMLRGDDHPRTELRKPLGTYSAYLSPRYRGDATDSLASLRRLRAMPVPSLVLPGHPVAEGTPQSPSLSQERWESLLDQGIRDMETLLARYQADGPDFLDGVPKQILPDMYYLGDFRGFCVYGFFVSSKFFVVDAPGGTGFVEFLKSRLKQLGRDWAEPTAVLLTSCGANETAALSELVEKCHTQVVAPAAGVDKLKESCPPKAVFVPTDELPGKGWFPVTSTLLEWRGSAPVAYQVAWTGKNVLFSGRIPAKLTQRSGEVLISELSPSTGDIRGYFASLVKLRGIKPDLWLPATSTDDQNANLYDSDWEHVIEDNLLVVQVIVAQSKSWQR